MDFRNAVSLTTVSPLNSTTTAVVAEEKVPLSDATSEIFLFFSMSAPFTSQPERL